MRYDRMARDLDIDLTDLRENMMFASGRPGDLMKVNMSAEDAKSWLGVTPPDLSLTARSRGPDWIYTYMAWFLQGLGHSHGMEQYAFPERCDAAYSL